MVIIKSRETEQMNKNDIIDLITQKTGVKKRTVDLVVDSFMQSIVSGLEKGEDVSLRGVGRFYTKERKARIGRNPNTGDKIEIKAKNVVKFNPSLSLKKAVDQM